LPATTSSARHGPRAGTSSVRTAPTTDASLVRSGFGANAASTAWP
jgi:hypothetical protein